MVSIFHAIFSLCLCGSALAQIPSLGPCPRIQGQADFDSSKFGGDWYELSRYFALFQLGAKCTVVNWEHHSNSSATWTNTFKSRFLEKTRRDRINFTLNRNDPSHMRGKLPMSPMDAVSRCQILGTDYDHFAVGYCCTDYLAVHLEYAWILGRERLPDKSVWTKAYDVIKEKKIGTKYFWKTGQLFCGSRPSK